MTQPSGDLAFDLLRGNAKFQKALASTNRQRAALGTTSMTAKQFVESCAQQGILKPLVRTLKKKSGKSTSYSKTRYGQSSSERTWGGKYGEDDYS